MPSKTKPPLGARRRRSHPLANTPMRCGSLGARISINGSRPTKPWCSTARTALVRKSASAYADPQNPSPNDIIRTPVFDRMAKEGGLFQHAFVSVSSCTPSRAALNSGRHFFRNGSHAQLHFPWQKGVPDPFEKIKGMPLVLLDGGYHIGLAYKLHLRAGVRAAHARLSLCEESRLLAVLVRRRRTGGIATPHSFIFSD
jgi:hypothetical protein